FVWKLIGNSVDVLMELLLQLSQLVWTFSKALQSLWSNCTNDKTINKNGLPHRNV
ncbi:unnamed protein product, partial [Allacma fusca]